VKKRIVTASVAILLITGGGWFGFKRYRCQERSAAFRRLIHSSIPEQILSTGIFGAFFMRRRPRLAALQVATLVYGMIVKIFGL